MARDDSPVLALLPSPLLGPATWSRVAAVLRRDGWEVVVPASPRDLRTPTDVVDSFTDQLPHDRRLALVPHSNAGCYVPTLRRRLRVVAQVFVDAVLPASRGPVPLAPPAFLEHLARLADADGVLPPWPQWFPAPDIAAEFPDDVWQQRVCREAQRIPLSYFRETLRVPSGWDDVPSAYLGFGDTYGDEQSDARRRHWPVEVLDGRHLHLVRAPDDVADAVTRLLDLSSPRPVHRTSTR